jgi:hypothetical protein
MYCTVVVYRVECILLLAKLIKLSHLPPPPFFVWLLQVRHLKHREAFLKQHQDSTFILSECAVEF